MLETLEKEGLIFKEKVRLTKIEEFGYSWQEFIEAKTPIPGEGLNFDIHFEGEIYGEQINGKVKGVDYLFVRPDGKMMLNLHALIITEDGGRIKLRESGVNENGALRLNMDFNTQSPKYTWLNKKHVWGIGNVDFQTGEVTVQGYQN